MRLPTLPIAVPVVVLAVLLFSPPPADGARTWHVLPDGSGDAPHLKAAADSSRVGDIIILGPGTYTGPGNRDVEFRRGVSIRSSHGPAVTTIDCEMQGAGLILGDPLGGQEDFDVSGITIRNPVDPRSPDFGRALYFYFSRVVLSDCVFVGGDPGGVGFQQCSGALLLYCRFFDMPGPAIDRGHGGIEVVGTDFTRVNTGLRSNAVVSIVYSRFTDGIDAVVLDQIPVPVEIDGGIFIGNRRGVVVRETEVDLLQCTFEGNTTAAVTASPGSEVSMRRCFIRDNPGRPFAGGGRLDIQSCEIVRNGQPIGGAQDLHLTVDRSTIADNDEAAIYTWASAVDIRNSTIARNGGFALVMDGEALIRGCAITDNGGGIYVERVGLTLQDNLIVHNAGRIRFDLPGGTMTGNTIVANRAPGDVLIESNQGGLTAARNIIAFNRAGTLFAARSGAITVRACDIFANNVEAAGTYTDGGDNLSADPSFCNRFDRDYTLQDDSPCLGAFSPTGQQIGAFGAGCAPVFADLKIVPHAVNPKAKDIITATLSGENVDAIDPGTVRLNGVATPITPEVVAADGAHKAGPGAPAAASCHDNQVSFRFGAAGVAHLLSGNGRHHDVTLTAQLRDGTPLRAATGIVLAGPLPAPGADDTKSAGNTRNGAEDDPITTGAVVPTPTMGVPATGPESAAPAAPGIHAVTPNPFNPVTQIRFGVTKPGHVILTIHDVTGRVVARLTNGYRPAGEHFVTWSAGDIPSGVYFARLVTPDGTFTRKLVVAR